MICIYWIDLLKNYVNKKKSRIELNASIVQDCVEDGTWVVLEPIMTVEVNSPIEFTSSVFSMLTKRSGMVTGQDGRDDWFTVEAEVPLNRMFGFSGELRGLTQGKGRKSDNNSILKMWCDLWHLFLTPKIFLSLFHNWYLVSALKIS